MMMMMKMMIIIRQFLSPLGIACDLLDEIFLNLPSEICFSIGIKSSKPKERKAAYIVIAMMVEGDNLSILLKACLKGVMDTDSTVRKCALEAVTHIHQKY